MTKNNLSKDEKTIMKMKDLSDKEKQKWITKLRRMNKQTENLKDEFGKFYSDANDIIFKTNPVGIASEDNLDAYSLEAEEILKKIKRVSSEKELEAIIISIFIDFFYKEIVIERKDLYKKMASKIWKLWKKYGNK